MFNTLEKHKKNRIFPESLADFASKGVLLFRSIHQSDLENAHALQGAKLFYSLWEGYLEQNSGLELKAWAETHRIPLRLLHTSGHASPSDLKRFAEALAPRTLVPIHSNDPSRYSGIYSNTTLLEDGRTLILETIL